MSLGGQHLHRTLQCASWLLFRWARPVVLDLQLLHGEVHIAIDVDVVLGLRWLDSLHTVATSDDTQSFPAAAL